jgi:molybdopterin synthase catalytic subunit
MSGLHEEESFWEDAAYTADDTLKIFLTTDKLSVTESTDFVRSEHAGAVIFFGGTTRDSFEGKGVALLSYEAHKKLALRTLTRICKEAKEKFKNEAKDELIHKIYLTHRLGEVPVKEESVIIALSSTHRKEGWEAAVWILERVKERAEIWKSENYTDGTKSWKENENSNVKGR